MNRTYNTVAVALFIAWAIAFGNLLKAQRNVRASADALRASICEDMMDRIAQRTTPLPRRCFAAGVQRVIYADAKRR